MSAKSRVILTVWIIGTAICATLVVRMHLSTDMSAFLPRSPSAEQQVLVNEVRNGMVSRLVLVGIEGAPPDTLAQLSRSLGARLRAEDDFISVENGDNDAVAADRDFFWHNRYLLSPDITADRFTVPGLRMALEKDLQLLGSPMAAAIKRSLPNDPTGEILKIANQVLDAARPRTRTGIWMSADERRAVLAVETRAPGFDIDRQQDLLTHIGDAFASLKREVPGSAAAHLLESGPSVFSVRTRALMERDATMFSILASVAVAGLLLFSYRSPRMLVLGFLPVATGALAGIAAVAVSFGYVHGITLGFGVTLIGEAVDYAIYLFTQTPPGHHPSETLARIWPTLVIGALTSVSGFSVMLFSSFAGFAQLGLFSIVGLLVALAVTRWVLPVIGSRGPASTASRLFAAPLAPIVRWASWLQLGVLLISAAAGMMLLFHSGGLWEQDLAKLSPIPAADQALDRSLRQDVSAPDVRYLIVVTAPGEQEALDASTRMSSVLRNLISQGALDGFNAPDQILPSAATQRTRQAALPDPQTLTNRLADARQGLPFRPNVFLPFLDDVAATKNGPLLTRNALPASVRLKLDSLLFERDGHWVTVLPLRGLSNPGRVAGAIAGLTGPRASFVDLKSESGRLLATYERDAVRLAIFGGLAILALMIAALRSPLRAFVVAVPLAASVIVTAAVLSFGHQKLSIFNLLGLLIIVSVGSNYSLFFERQARDPEYRSHLAASVVLANLCTVCGYGVVSLSAIPVLHDIGITVAIGTLLSLVFAAVLSTGPFAYRIGWARRRAEI